MNGMTIAIGPHTYAVQSDETADLELDADDNVGSCTSYLCRIRVHSKATLSMQRDALLHEVMHAVWYQVGLGASKRLNEEQIILAMTTPLLDVLQANPHLVEFLTA